MIELIIPLALGFVGYHAGKILIELWTERPWRKPRLAVTKVEFADGPSKAVTLVAGAPIQRGQVVVRGADGKAYPVDISSKREDYEPTI